MRRHRILGTPWMGDSACTHAWVANASYMGATSGTIGAWLPQKGNVSLTQSTAGYKPSFLASGWGSKNQGRVSFDGIDDHMFADSIATLVSGSDVPFSIIMACAPATATPASARNLMGFGRSSTASQSVHPFILTTAGHLATDRQADAGGIVAATTTDVVDTSRQVFTLIFDGTTTTIRRNNVVTSVNGATLNVGTVTFDEFTVGANRRITLDSAVGKTLRTVLLFAGTSPTAANIDRHEDYLLDEAA